MGVFINVLFTVNYKMTCSFQLPKTVNFTVFFFQDIPLDLLVFLKGTQLTAIFTDFYL